MRSLLSDQSEYAIKTFIANTKENVTEEETRQSGGRQSPLQNIYRTGTQCASAKSDFDMPAVGLAATTRHGGSGGGRRFGYFLDQIILATDTITRFTSLQFRGRKHGRLPAPFDLANPKDGGFMRIGIDMSDAVARQWRSGHRRDSLTCSVLFREASSYRLVAYLHDGLPTDGLPEGTNTSTWTLPRDPGGRTSSEARRGFATNPDGLDSLLILSPFERGPTMGTRIDQRTGCGRPPWV